MKIRCSNFVARIEMRAVFLILACAIVAHGHPLHAQSPAPTPPMGWSAWDAYGSGVTEAEFRANATVLASLRQYGWQYAMLDYGWYVADLSNLQAPGNFALDANGRLLPVANRFPSAADGAGFKSLADWLHARGLKLGIHVMLGIPRQAVSGNLPIADSNYRAGEAADAAETCSWDREFYVANDNPAGQAYYDSLARLYAAWGVDLIKLGCVSDSPFHASEIRQFSAAIRRAGRPMVVELSPGPLPPDFAPGPYAQMWRIAPEHWDVWNTPPGKSGFPVGIRDEFDLLAHAEHDVMAGSWIDPDLLADGWLAPHPAWGEPRHSRLSGDEERTEFTLWAFARSPLIEGANLTRLDAPTRALMTDRTLLRIDQHAKSSQAVEGALPGVTDVRVWKAQTQDGRVYLAIFNLDDHARELKAAWSELGVTGREHAALDEASGSPLPRSDHLTVSLAAHGSAVYEIR